MFNLKPIAIIFFVGFLLSFFAGLIGQVGFGVIFLRAVLSGTICIILYYGALTIYNKFLLNAEAMDSESASVQGESSSHAVDIVVEDELPDSATAPSFNVSDFSSAPVQSSNSEEEQVEELANEPSSSFQSTSLASMTNNGSADSISGEDVEELAELEPEMEEVGNENREALVTEVTRPSEYIHDSDMVDVDSNSELGELPDMESLGVDEGDVSQGDSDDIIQDSVFAETGDTRPSAEPVAVSEMGDAKDIAAAIRTAMAKDT